TQADLEPNTKFVDNKIFRLLGDSRVLRLMSEQNKVNWVGVEHHEMFKKIMTQIRESELYFTYMNSDVHSFEEDKEFVLTMFTELIAPNEKLYEYLEDNKLTWIDDIPLV
ncbi:MAG: antitermination protein NusB, partial [bacterium]